MGAYKKSLKETPHNVKMWEEFSGSAKIVLKVYSQEELIKVQEKAKNNKIPNYLVSDAGRTQVAPGTITVCAIGPGKVSEIDKITGNLSLL